MVTEIGLWNRIILGGWKIKRERKGKTVGVAFAIMTSLNVMNESLNTGFGRRATKTTQEDPQSRERGAVME